MGPQSEQRMAHLRRKLENEFLVLDILNMYVPLGRSGGGGLVVVAMSGEGVRYLPSFPLISPWSKNCLKRNKYE